MTEGRRHHLGALVASRISEQLTVEEEFYAHVRRRSRRPPTDPCGSRRIDHPAHE